MKHHDEHGYLALSRSLEGLAVIPAPGTHVRLSGAARARMGLRKGADATWIVVECRQLELDGAPCRLCGSGRHVWVNAGRHVAVAALTIVGTLDTSVDSLQELTPPKGVARVSRTSMKV